MDKWSDVVARRFGEYKVRQAMIPDWPVSHDKFKFWDRVYKTNGSLWRGRIVGWYITQITPEGYCVESEKEPGSVHTYPADELAMMPDSLSDDE